MMKSISIFVALVAILLANAALAAGAIATSVTGTVTVQSGTAAPRALHQGDAVSQGDTIVTSAASSTVLRFDDGEVTALTSSSRMQVTAYQYNASNNSGNVFLSLLSGGMRAITGLIGRNQPSSVAYRAATATIGIRGTEVDIATDGTSVAVSVIAGEITFTSGDKTVRLSAGQGALARVTGSITSGNAATIFNSLSADLQKMLGSIEALSAAISMSTASGTNANTTEVVTGANNVTSTVTGTGSGGGGVSKF